MTKYVEIEIKEYLFYSMIEKHFCIRLFVPEVCVFLDMDFFTFVLCQHQLFQYQMSSCGLSAKNFLMNE